MRTSYVPKNKQPEKPKSPEPVSQVQEIIIHAYIDIREFAIKKRELDDYKSLSKKISKETVDTGDISDGGDLSKENPKKSKKKFWIIFSFILILIISLGVGFYFLLFRDNVSTDDLEVKISKLYTSSQRLDIKNNVTQDSLKDYYTEALELKKKGLNVNKIEYELDTIGYFLQDKGKLLVYQDLSYDLSNPIMLEDITKIRENTKNYNVSGLAVTITEMSQDILNSYNNYIKLKSELESISDISKFDEDEYKRALDSITHSPNKTELEGTYNKLVADKNKADAEAKVKKAKNRKAKQEAKKALDDAKALQKKTQKELESIQSRLNEVESQKETQTMQIESVYEEGTTIE